jgi:hypothetical protein
VVQLAHQTQGPEFNPQYWEKKKKKAVKFSEEIYLNFCIFVFSRFMDQLLSQEYSLGISSVAQLEIICCILIKHIIYYRIINNTKIYLQFF